MCRETSKHQLVVERWCSGKTAVSAESSDFSTLKETEGMGCVFDLEIHTVSFDFNSQSLESKFVFTYNCSLIYLDVYFIINNVIHLLKN